MNKRILYLILITLTGYTSLSAVDVVEKDNNSNTSNEIDDSYSERKGWSFYFDDNISDKSKQQASKEIKKAELDLLQKILDENRKQTETQNKILALLQEQMNPQPKTISVNGKECIENSSAQCFKFPLIAEAKRVPVMAEFLKDPYDITKAAKYLQWQAKYFEHAINIGNSLQFASSQFGEKAYPIGAQSSQYTPGAGNYEGRILPHAQKNMITKMKEKISYSIFIGKNINMDIYSALSIVEIIKEYGEMNFELVFYDKKSKDVFIGAIESVWLMDKLQNWEKVKKIVDTEKFKTFDIFATPSYVLKFKNDGKNEAQTIARGKVDITTFRQKTVAFLEMKKLIDYEKMNEYNNWEGKDGENYMKNYYEEKGANIENILKSYKK